MFEHWISVLDREGITACECGMQMFTRPGANALTVAFIEAHAEAMAR